MARTVRPTPVHSFTAYSVEASWAVGQADHLVQVRVVCQAPSRAVFARALVDAGLAYGRGLTGDKHAAAVSRAARDLAQNSQTTGNQDEIALAATAPGTVFVGPLDDTDTARYVAWPAA